MPRSRHGSRPASRAASRPGSRPSSMVSTALSLSPTVQVLGRDLIELLTGLDPDVDGEEENFGRCEDFFTSNMLYHTFLDPRPKEVEKKLEAISEKLVVQAKSRKAKRIQNLVDAFGESPIFNPDLHQHQQHDIQTRLLSFLLHLSNADNSDVDYDGPLEVTEFDDTVDIIDQKRREEVKQWQKILDHGEEKFRYPAVDSELSDWSSDDDGIKEPEDPVPGRFRKSISLDNFRLPGCLTPLQPPAKILPPGTPVVETAEESRRKLQALILPQYWIKEKDGKANIFPLEVTSKSRASNFVEDLDRHFHRDGIPVTEKMMLSEYQVIREIILTFRCPSSCDDDLPLFFYDKNRSKFLPNDANATCTPSLTSETLSTCLTDICEPLTSKRRLDEFIDEVLGSLKYAMTIEAYAEALSGVLDIFSADLTRVELKAKSHTTFTILDLINELAEWFMVLNSLCSFHLKSVLNPSKQVSKEDYNWQSSMVLLANLHEAIDTKRKTNMYVIYVDLFLKSLAPYFKIIGLWVSQGRLEDWREEFVFAVNPAFHADQMKILPDGESKEELQDTFWTLGFIKRPYRELLNSHGLPVPRMFINFFSRILNCGKSIEILSVLQKLGRLPKTSSAKFKQHVSDSQIYDQFLENLKTFLTFEIEPDVEEASHHRVAEVISVQNIVDVDDFDPLMTAAFQSLLDEHCNEESVEKDILKYLEKILTLQGAVLDPMRPLTNKFEQSLVPIVTKHVDYASEHLLKLFLDTLDLKTHMEWVRKVYLMEAGDVMSEFYSGIFEFQDWDEISLTMHLRDCLSMRSDTFCERFTITVDEEDCNSDLLDKMTLTYDAEWPLNIVMTSDSFIKYNEVFRFMMKVKKSIWALNQIQARDLEVSTNLASEFVENLTKNNEEFLFDESRLEITKGLHRNVSTLKDMRIRKHEIDFKIHRILHLKCWLLHFVGIIHSYFMTRVLHTTELELRDSLDKNAGNSLDGIIAAHDSFIDSVHERCLLHPSASFLRKALLIVLDACLQLHDLCKTFTQLFEEEQSSSDSDLETKQTRCQMLKRHGSMLISDRSLNNLEESYSRSHQFIATTLRNMIQNRNLPHLEGLASSLFNSLPRTRS